MNRAAHQVARQADSRLGGLPSGSPHLNLIREFDFLLRYVHPPLPAAFDLLHLESFDTRAAPLIERKRVLENLLKEADTKAPRVVYIPFPVPNVVTKRVCNIGASRAASPESESSRARSDAGRNATLTATRASFHPGQPRSRGKTQRAEKTHIPQDAGDHFEAHG